MANRIGRILAALLAIGFIYSAVAGLLSTAFVLRDGMPPEVALVYASETAAVAVFGVICLFFVKRGDLPSGGRQAASGCLLALGTGALFIFIAALLVAILNLREGLEDAIRLATVFAGSALGGILGLYLGRPSSTFLWNRGEDKKGFVGSRFLAIVSTNRKSVPESSVLVSVITALAASFLGYWLTYLSFLLAPCIPPEAASDSGAARAFAAVSFSIWIVAGPLAVLCAGLMAYGTIRWFKLGQRKSHSLLAAGVSGGFSGLVFTIISVALFQALLCMG